LRQLLHLAAAVPSECGIQDFYIDLLFYRLKLRCFVVITVKKGVFKPEFAEKLTFTSQWLWITCGRIMTSLSSPLFSARIKQNRGRVMPFEISKKPSTFPS